MRDWGDFGLPDEDELAGLEAPADPLVDAVAEPTPAREEE